MLKWLKYLIIEWRLKKARRKAEQDIRNWPYVKRHDDGYYPW